MTFARKSGQATVMTQVLQPLLPTRATAHDAFDRGCAVFGGLSNLK
jgi:hypothetical protein